MGWLVLCGAVLDLLWVFSTLFDFWFFFVVLLLGLNGGVVEGGFGVLGILNAYCFLISYLYWGQSDRFCILTVKMQLGLLKWTSEWNNGSGFLCACVCVFVTQCWKSFYVLVKVTYCVSLTFSCFVILCFFIIAMHCKYLKWWQLWFWGNHTHSLVIM